MNTCSVGSPPVSIQVFHKEAVNCGDVTNAKVLKDAQGECKLIDGADQGAALSFSNNQSGQTEYLIRVSSTDGNAFEFPGDMEINIQGGVSGSCGDPHFYRWQHPVRDSFHGECDMVLFHKENIAADMDMDVHIRTTIRDSYSYIEAAAVKIGTDAMEFQMDGVYVNGEMKSGNDFPLSVGTGGVQIAKDVTSIKPKYVIVVDNKVALVVTSTKHFMSVKFAGHPEYLDGSLGMLGDHKTGDMVSRDGSIFPEGEFEQFAFEWQVHPTDPQIFMHAREPQLPYERCRMPATSAESRRRKLRGQDRKLYEQAVAACAENHIEENVQSCVDDVMFTGDLELAEAF